MLILFLLAFNLCEGLPPPPLYRNQVCGFFLGWHFTATCILVYVPDLYSTKKKRKKKLVLLVNIKMATVDGSKIQCNRKQIRLNKLENVFFWLILSGKLS